MGNVDEFFTRVIRSIIYCGGASGRFVPSANFLPSGRYFRVAASSDWRNRMEMVSITHD